MSYSLKNKFTVALFKFALLTLPIITIVFLLVRNNNFFRNILIGGILVLGFYLTPRLKRSKSTTYDEIGYWSGLDDFELGIFDEIFGDSDIDDDLNVSTEEHYTEKPV